MKNQREGLIVTHVYEFIKIFLLSMICWSFIDSRQTSLKVLETIDQIKAISKTNYQMMMKEDIDLDSFINKKLQER